MKKLINLIVLALVFSGIVFAQTNYSSYDGKHKVYQGYVSSMGDDSTGNFYSEAIDLSEFTNNPIPLPVYFSNVSAGGTPSVSWSAEYRIYDKVTDAYTSWALLDSISSLNATETLQSSVAVLAGNERPVQVRIKADGQTGNPSDVVLKWWVFVRKD